MRTRNEKGTYKELAQVRMADVRQCIISDEDKYYIDNYGFNKSYCNEITLYFSEVIQNFINKKTLGITW